MNRCIRCGTEMSRSGVIGPRCRTRVLRKARSLRGFSAEQVDKAVEMIDTGAILRLRKRRVFLSVSSKGHRYYRTAVQSCTCPGSVHTGRCYHQLAALLLQ